MQATWSRGFWVRDMTQRCYGGTHARLYLPIGIACVLLLCAGPPLVTLLVLWRKRARLDEHHVMQTYGFMYRRYRNSWYFWESVVQVETLALVMVDVFGRTLSTFEQALVLLAVLQAISSVNMTCGAPRHRLLVR